MISIVIPTIDGREELLANAVTAYRDHTPDAEIIIEHGHRTVGLAWQAGAEKSSGDYIHLTNDDLEPRPGWWLPAVEAVDRGFCPAPLVLSVTGVVECLPTWGILADDWAPVASSTIPFCGRDQWEKIQPLYLGHYYTDNFFSDRAIAAGWPCRFRAGYAFVNHTAQVGRGATHPTQREREEYDLPMYREALLMVMRGEWTRPWPPGGMQP